MATRELALLIDSRLENVALVGLAVAGVAEDLGLDRGSSGIELCVVEAVTNAVRHAYRGEPGHQVTTLVRILADRIEISVKERGTPMPLDRRDPRLPEVDPSDPLSIPEGGRGLYLIHHFMDQVEYRTEDGTNVLVMTKRLPASRLS